MKKTLFLLPIAVLAMLTTAESAANAKTTQVFKQTATVYQIKKVGKAYKITSQTKKTADRDLNISKSINVKGKPYYYSHVFKGYINDNAYGVNAKLDAKRAKADTSSSTTGKKKNTTTSSNTISNANVKNGYNYDTNEITNFNEYSNVYVQTALNEINNYRTSHGADALTLDATLTKIAQTRAEQNYNYRNATWFDGHDDQNGNFIAAQLAKSAGLIYQTISENSQKSGLSGLDGILEGPEEAAKAEVNSSIVEGPQGGHYQNIMDTTVTKIGIGIYVGPNQGQQTEGAADMVFTN